MLVRLLDDESADLPRLLSLYCSGPGFFVSSTLVVWSAYFLAVTLLILSMLRMETFFPTLGLMQDLQFTGYEIPNQGTKGDEQTLGAEFLLQIGFLMVLPIFAEEVLEFGLRLYVIGRFLRII